MSPAGHGGATAPPLNEDMKHRIAIIVIVVLAITGSLAAYYRSSGSTGAPQYTTAMAVRGDVVETVEATGTLGAVMTVQVGSQVSGTIKSLHADFNSIVGKGQVIARLDPSLFQAQVDQAEATIARLQADVDRARVALEDAQVKRDRARELFSRGLIPAAEVETAESTARQAQSSVTSAQAQVVQAGAALNQNRVNLSHTVIASPVDGIVISRNVDVGQTVAASMSAPTLFVIANDLADMQVDASVDEADVGRIRADQRVTFRVDAYPRDTFTGVVSQVRLQPVVQQNVVTYVTVIDVPNPDGKLKPGMTASVTIEVARAENVLKVPNAALRFQPAAETLAASARQTASERGRRVWTLTDEQLQAVPVRTGISDGTTTAIVDGNLAENTTLVTAMASRTTTKAAQSTSPLIPQPPGGNRQRSGAGG
jgi:HlyD family secretion protein